MTKLNDDAVESMMYEILAAAETEQWKLAYFGASMDGPDSVQVGSKKFADSTEEMYVANEAFERMRDELNWVRWHEGIWYKVTAAGRQALAEKRRTSNMTDQKLLLASITYTPEQTTAVVEWAKKHNVEIIYKYYPQGTFPNNIVKVLSGNEAVMGLNAHGFVLPEQSIFKPAVLKELFQLLTDNHFYMFSADRDVEPFTDEDIDAVAPPAVAGHSSINYTTNFYNTGASVNLAPGATAHSIQQINNNIQTIEQQTPSVAHALQEVTEAVEVAEIPNDNKEETLERLNEISTEVAKPETERKGWKVKERFDGLMNSISKGAETGGKLGEAYVKLQPLIEALGKALGGS